MQRVTKSNLHTRGPVLPFLQMALYLPYTMMELSQSKALILEQL